MCIRDRSRYIQYFAPGGAGGGGNGSYYISASDAPVAQNGTNELGGGGGGAYGYLTSYVGTGGSGTVIIKSSNPLTTTGTTLNPDGAVSGFYIYKFNTTGGNFSIS